MSEPEIPDSVRKPLEQIILLCNQHNVPAKNLLYDECVPDEIICVYDDLLDAIEDYPDISWGKIIRFIGENVDIDLSEESKFYLDDIAVTQKENIALTTYPELKDTTQNGLIKVPPTVDMNINGFEYKDHYLIFNARLSDNRQLIKYLKSLRSDTINVSASITVNQLGDPNTTRNSFQKEHWAGPQTVDYLKSRRAPEFTQKGTESYQDGIMDCTEFYFDTRDDKWHIQIEELLPMTGIQYSPHITLHGEQYKFYTRYVHAIIASDCERCYHIDGAFRTYQTKDRFIKRHTQIDLQQPNELKQVTERHKLFKIDSSDEGFSDYQELIGLFFKRNPHVKEFFEGESELTREQERKRSRLLEYSFENGHVDGF